MSSSGTFGRRQGALPQTWTAPSPRRPDGRFSLAPTLAQVPLVSVGLLLALAAVFCMQEAMALEPPVGLDLSYRSLIALGGVSGKLVLTDGQWWRLFTAPLMHAGVSHIVGNSVVLLLVGWRLEHLIGRRWFAAIFALSALGGSLASALLRASQNVGVGASGAIMGLLAAAIVLSLHSEAHEVGPKMRARALWLAIPALIPTSPGTDYSGHLGGAMVGVVVGFLLQIFWPEAERRPGHSRTALAIAGVWAAGSVLAWIPVAVLYPYYVTRNLGLIPDAAMPRHLTDKTGAALRIAETYPDDPRAHLIRGLARLEQKDPYGAERELRLGLADTDRLLNDMHPGVRYQLQVGLVVALLIEGRQAEAREAAAPMCAIPAADLSLNPFRRLVEKAKLCG